MLKLLFMLAAFLVLGLTMLGLRQREWALRAEAAAITEQIRARGETLRDQRAEIAAKTNPITLAAELKNRGLDLGMPTDGLDAIPATLRHDGGGSPAPRRSSSSSGSSHGDGDRDLIAPLHRRHGH